MRTYKSEDNALGYLQLGTVPIWSKRWQWGFTRTPRKLRAPECEECNVSGIGFKEHKKCVCSACQTHAVCTQISVIASHCRS